MKCRHIPSFQNGEPPLGVSILIAVQNYTASGNEGIPKSIRGNTNCCAIQKIGNMKELNSLRAELSGVLPEEDIWRAYNGNLNPRPPKSRRPGDELKTLKQVTDMCTILFRHHISLLFLKSGKQAA